MLATVPDFKYKSGSDPIFKTLTLTANDYYPFGMIMPERTYDINDQALIPVDEEPTELMDDPAASITEIWSNTLRKHVFEDLLTPMGAISHEQNLGAMLLSGYGNSPTIAALDIHVSPNSVNTILYDIRNMMDSAIGYTFIIDKAKAMRYVYDPDSIACHNINEQNLYQSFKATQPITFSEEDSTYRLSFVSGDSSDYILVFLRDENTSDTSSFLVDNVVVSTPDMDSSNIILSEAYDNDSIGWENHHPMNKFLYSQVEAPPALPQILIDSCGITATQGKLTLYPEWVFNDIDSTYMAIATRDFEVDTTQNYMFTFAKDDLHTDLYYMVFAFNQGCLLGDNGIVTYNMNAYQYADSIAYTFNPDSTHITVVIGIFTSSIPATDSIFLDDYLVATYTQDSSNTILDTLAYFDFEDDLQGMRSYILPTVTDTTDYTISAQLQWQSATADVFVDNIHPTGYDLVENAFITYKYVTVPPQSLINGSIHVKDLVNSFIENSFYFITKKEAYVNDGFLSIGEFFSYNPNIITYGVISEGINEFQFYSPEDGEIAILLASFDDYSPTSMVFDDFVLYTHPYTTVTDYTFDSTIAPWRNTILNLPDDTLPTVAGIHTYDDSTITLSIEQTLLDGQYAGLAARIVGGLTPNEYYQYHLEISSEDITFDTTTEAALMLFDKEEYEHQGIWNSEPLAYVPITQWGSYTSPAVQTRSDGVALVLFVRSGYGSAGGSFRIGSLQQQHSGIATPGQDNNYAIASVTLPTYAYRYGFNGQERETQLNPSITSAEYWFYDGRLGRRWNVDPVVKPWRSSYDAFRNCPLLFIDPEGDDDYYLQITKVDGQTEVSVVGFIETGDRTPNRFFVLDPNANQNTEYRKEYNGYYYEMVMIPSQWYSDEDFERIEYSTWDQQSQFELDRREWLGKSGKIYSSKRYFRRFIEDQKDSHIPEELCEDLKDFPEILGPFYTVVAAAEEGIKKSKKNTKISEKEKALRQVEYQDSKKHTSSKSASKKDKHTKTRSGGRYEVNKNDNRGAKNKKFQPKVNPNKKYGN